MPKLHDDWQVLPHGPLREVEPGLLTVVGQIPMPLGNFPRRMSVVGLSDRRTAIYSPMALGEEEMGRIEALGAPAFLIIPNPSHRLDARPFVERYPAAKVITAPNAVKRVEEAVPVSGASADLGPSAELVEVRGVDRMELAMLVRHPGGATLLTNDIIGHVKSPQGPGAWIMARLMGFGPRPQVPRVARRMLVREPQALVAQFREWAAMEDLVRLIPSHGDPIERPAPLLQRLAGSLER